MAIETRISAVAYQQTALADPDRKWELHDGRLREKPGMTAAHNDLAAHLGYMLWNPHTGTASSGPAHYRAL